MWTAKIAPRFNDTDALGHINNTAMLSWFESARSPVFRIFVPDLDPRKWQLIIARLEIDYLSAAFYGHEVELETRVLKVGNSSFVLEQKAFQLEKIVAQAKCVMVRYDYNKECSLAIDQQQRKALLEHLFVE